METKGHKGKRILLFGLLAFLVAILGISASGYAATGIADLQAHATVLTNESIIIGDYGIAQNGSVHKMLLSNSNGTAYITDDYLAGNGTGYYSPDYLISNVTVADLNAHAVNNISIVSNLYGNVTLEMGYGSSPSNFVAIGQFVVGNTTTQSSLAVSPADLTGNQSSYLMFKVEFGKGASFGAYTIHFTTKGIKSTSFGYMTGEDVGYSVSGALLFIFGIMALPHYDTSYGLSGKWKGASASRNGKNRRR
ncbi:MAG: hypothetical protein QXU18_04670 [Thermoplasmatales archaeon]